jgi:quinol-cytochrome oxidoreductase complex cytochrome b subunit
MFGSLIILFFLPNLRNIISVIELKKNNNIYFNLEILTLQFNPIKQFFFWLFFFDMCLLGWLGAQPVEYPFITLGLIATLFYFFYIICIIPLLVLFEIILISFYFKNKCQN